MRVQGETTFTVRITNLVTDANSCAEKIRALIIDEFQPESGQSVSVMVATEGFMVEKRRSDDQDLENEFYEDT